MDFYKTALFAARGEYQRLLAKRTSLDEQRAKIEIELNQILQTIQGLAVLAKEKMPGGFGAIQSSDLKGLGLADACRKILAAEDRFMSPRLVRNMLSEKSYDLSPHKNPLASIHAVLKRFEESGEAESLKMGGKAGYRLKREISQVVPTTTKMSKAKKK